ncbi:DB module domain-containing protein [Ditylenchus destructor]|nr:DB module domain-containing protein [Ditylenchus destructor]
MIALKLFLFFLVLTLIIADYADRERILKDSEFLECCEARKVHKKFLEVSCNYTSLFNSSIGPPLVDKDLISDLPDIVECSANGKDHTECCKKGGVSEECLPLCNGKPPIELAKFAACRKVPPAEKRKVLQCFYDHAYKPHT